MNEGRQARGSSSVRHCSGSSGVFIRDTLGPQRGHTVPELIHDRLVFFSSQQEARPMLTWRFFAESHLEISRPAERSHLE